MTTDHEPVEYLGAMGLHEVAEPVGEDGLRACPRCGAAVQPDRYSPDDSDPEMAVNCDGCDTITLFNSVQAGDWSGLRVAWNTRTRSLITAEQVEEAAKVLCCRKGCENAGRPYDPMGGSVSICQSHTYREGARAVIRSLGLGIEGEP